MGDWSSGYVADIDHTYGYYQELNPARANLSLLSKGFKALKSTLLVSWGSVKASVPILMLRRHQSIGMAPILIQPKPVLLRNLPWLVALERRYMKRRSQILVREPI